MSRAIIHSYGGGVQSAAIAVLVVQGRLPRPERIVMADTGREASLTWAYLHEHIDPLLALAELKVEIAPHSLSKVDTHAKTGAGRPLFPVFTDSGGRLPNLCSVEWKRRVVGRWLRAEGYGPRKPVVQWLGISTDEVHRMKPSDLEWAALDFPLIDLNLKRSDCITLVEKAGLPTPPRSSCWMCPFRSDAEWMSLRERGDGDWDRAVKMDRQIRKDGIAGELFLHRSARPLDQIEFRHEKQGNLFDVCEEGRCEF